MATGAQQETEPFSSRFPSLPTSPDADDLSNVATSTSAPSRLPPPTLQLRRSSSGANTRLVRRVTTQERLDEILEIGHQRALSMSPGRSPPVFRSPSRTAGGTPGTPPTSGEVFSEYHGQWQQQNHAETPEPDETTGIVMKSSHPRGVPPGLNYQSMSGNENNGPRARARKTGTVKNTANGNENGHMNGNENGYEQNKEADAWWKTQLAKFGSIELENKGSVARDHLALERTFLAWLRTSLSFASIGIAITQLFRLNTSLTDAENTANNISAHTLRQLGKPLGAVFLGISILILFLGYNRYFQAQQWIIKGKFPASRGTVILVSLVALGLMIISLVVVLLVQPTTGSS